MVKRDVALLKVDAEGLLPVDYAATSNVPQGTWVVANGATTRTTRRITLTPTGASFDVWINGTKHTFTGAQALRH